MAKTPKRPRDVSQLAKMMVDIASGEVSIEETKNSAAVALGRKGGLKGGKARWASLTPEQRSEAAQLAAQARWRKKI
jgi:hypothetical protein